MDLLSICFYGRVVRVGEKDAPAEDFIIGVLCRRWEKAGEWFVLVQYVDYACHAVVLAVFCEASFIVTSHAGEGWSGVINAEQEQGKREQARAILRPLLFMMSACPQPPKPAERIDPRPEGPI